MLKSHKLLFLFLLIYLFFGQLFVAWPFTMDDSFISLTYAKNLVKYGILGWNKGQLIVEGYTNFSYVILASLAMKIGLNAIIVLKIISILMFALSLSYLYRLTRLWLTPQYAFIPSLWLLCYKGQILWTVSGLETSTFQCLMLLSTYYLLRGLGFQNASYNFQYNTSYVLYFNAFFLCGLFLSLAGLTRPETPVLMMSMFLITLLFYPEFKSKKKRFLQALGIILVVISLIYLPYFLWRWFYFGRLFPNSVYCKWLTHISPGILDWRYLKIIWPMLILSLPYFLSFKDKRTLFLITPSIIYLVLVYDTDIISGFFNRLFLPAFCLLLPLPLFGLIKFNMFCLQKARYIRISVYLCSIIIGVVFIPNFSLSQYHQFAITSKKSIAYRFKLINWLKSNIKKDETIVLADCGLIPYAIDINVIDSYCLNNPYMTKKHINYSYSRFVDWVLKKEKPKLIILSAWRNNAHGYIEPSASYFLKSNLFFSQYRLNHTINSRINGHLYSYHIYKRFSLE